MASKRTTIQSHGAVESEPSAVYGSGPVRLRLGNGGAGATGLLEALAIGYLKQRPGQDMSISWVCNHSRNTQLALLNGYIDVALTYERELEQLSAAEGWSVTFGCVFHDHFILAGPSSDPAGIKQTKTLYEALRKIAQFRVPFHSRADGSATMVKERGFWDQCNLHPYTDLDAQRSWYTTTTYSPAEAVRAADAAEAYLLTDRSTLLRQVTDGQVHRTTVFHEPESQDDVLMNSCFALHAPDPPKGVKSFLKYVSSAAGQNVIRTFGSAEVGVPLFAMVDSGFARNGLRGGRPKGGRWISDPERRRSSARL